MSCCNHFERDKRIKVRMCYDCYESKKSRDCNCDDCYDTKKIHNCNCHHCYEAKKPRGCDCKSCRRKYSYEKKCKKNERFLYCCDNYYEKCNKMVHHNENTENKDTIKSDNDNIIIININPKCK
jgi:hypothetical protein